MNQFPSQSLTACGYMHVRSLSHQETVRVVVSAGLEKMNKTSSQRGDVSQAREMFTVQLYLNFTHAAGNNLEI